MRDRKRKLAILLAGLLLASAAAFSAFADDGQTCPSCGYAKNQAGWKFCNMCGARLHAHIWQNATCESPKTCKECGAVEGDPADHSFTKTDTGIVHQKSAATCISKAEYYYSCSTCGKNGTATFTSGNTDSHQWHPATYSAPATCAVCGATEGTVRQNEIKQLWRNLIDKEAVQSIVFVQDEALWKEHAARGAVDFSAAEDGNILGWLENGELCISSLQRICFPEDSSLMFAGLGNVKSISFRDAVNTSGARDMRFLFDNCKNLTELDFQGFDTSAVTDMSFMFASCESLTQIDLRSFDTSNVTNMASMFGFCDSLKYLDLSGFDTSLVQDMSGMFSGCRQLSAVDLSGFDTSNVTDMSSMFYRCMHLTSLDLTNFNTSRVTTMNFMFGFCFNLQQIRHSFDMRNVTDRKYILNSSKLEGKESEIFGK